MKVVIVEDEVYSLELLKKHLEAFAPEIEIVGEASTVERAVDVIRAKMPDLVFLDLRLSDRLGFEVLDRLSVLDFFIIYTTGFEELQDQAWQYGGLDFLKKPVSEERLQQAIEKARIHFRQKSVIRHAEAKQRQPFVMITVPKGQVYDFITLDRILFCQAMRVSTILHLKGNIELAKSKSLGQLEELLSQHGFLRIHRSVIINTAHVTKYEDSTLILQGNIPQFVGSAYRGAVRDWINGENLG